MSGSAGMRDWKCPECGAPVQLSVTQLDPIACDACMAKSRAGNRSASGITEAVAAPMGIWSSLPDSVKLMIAIAGFVIGLLIGFVVGQFTASRISDSNDRSVHQKESARTRSSAHETDPVAEDDRSPADDAEVRPDPPGPGYKWMPGRKHKDGTRGDGYWAVDPHYKGEKSSKSKSTK